MASIGKLVTKACLLEALAPKVGNVHPQASFRDMNFGSFEASAMEIGPVFDRWRDVTMGWLVEESVRRTKVRVNVNTNLGMVLLLAPIAKALAPGFDSIQRSLSLAHETWTHSDSVSIYRAIAHASPGGLGKVDEMDIAEQAPAHILEAMKFAEDRDQVAREYCNGFVGCQEISDDLIAMRNQGRSWSQAICREQLKWISRFGDSLILRKNGNRVNAEVRERAGEVWQAWESDSTDAEKRNAEFDAYLRADGHRLNPGTTADLLAAGIFIALLRTHDDGQLEGYSQYG